MLTFCKLRGISILDRGDTPRPSGTMDHSDPSNFSYNFEIFEYENEWDGILFQNPSLIQTIPNGFDRTTTTRIDSRLYEISCDDLNEDEVLSLTARFIHETFHAYFHSWVLNDPTYDNVSFITSQLFSPFTTYFQISANLHLQMQGEEPVTMHHHALFYQFLFDEILESIYVLNARQGDISDYHYFVHQLINTQQMVNADPPPTWLNDLGIDVNFNIEDLKSDWDNVLLNHGFSLCD